MAQTTDITVSGFLSTAQKSLTQYKARNYNEKVFLKSAALAIMENDDLQACLANDAGKRSLYHALKFAAITGLSLNPQEGKAALVPRGGKVTYQIMKNGLVDLALGSGKVSFINADYVRDHDQWSGLVKTMDGINFQHIPASTDRGAIIGFYAVMRMTDGSTHGKYLTTQEIDEHRAEYSPKSSMPAIGYGIKTVMKSMLRSVSISNELTAAIGSDDAFEFDDEPGVTADEVASKIGKQVKNITPEVERDLL